MLHFGIVRPDERGLITNPLGLAAVRLDIMTSGEHHGRPPVAAREVQPREAYASFRRTWR
jgi:hypothetical protein